MVNIQVKPKPSNITSVQIQIYNVELFQSLSAYVNQYNEQNQIVKSDQIKLTNEEYENWMDDSELVNLLLSKVGLEKEDEEEEKKEENEPLPVEP
jgi:hypothetical protein